MIQIIGGLWRGRRIPVLARPGLRPTPGRVRETLFNWMGQDLTGLHCLDLFAGSGALGLEAASRHAASVTWVESDDLVCQRLRKTLAALATTPTMALHVHHGDAWGYVQRCGAIFDVIFLDPPFHQGWHERILPQLSRLTASGALVYAEAENNLEALAPWRMIKQKRTGSVWSHLLEKAA